ncbi:hypothetical protein SCUCBS95973_006007 [Sporothrix curviconia]|uniref:Uncharacterized protein n=1 Tax=Sporothrix curviconia TaxID=1260050 RepID=A0ABP0C1I6_9PEZI
MVNIVYVPISQQTSTMTVYTLQPAVQPMMTVPVAAAPTVLCPAQQPVYAAVNPTMPGGAVLVQPQPVGWPCEHISNGGSCWMHRPTGELKSLPPPAPGRPGQWIQWCNGSVTWLAASVATL